MRPSVARLVAQAVAQGLPEKVDDRLVLASVATIVRAASPQTRQR